MATQKVKIEVRNGDINRALKLFKRKTIESGHLDDLREKQEYKKPTTVKRKMMQQAKRANQRRVQENKEE